jgi:hypothetical protein
VHKSGDTIYNTVFGAAGSSGVHNVFWYRLTQVLAFADDDQVPNDLAHVQVVVELLLDAHNSGGIVPGTVELVGDIGVRAHQRNGRFVQGRALRLASVLPSR